MLPLTAPALAEPIGLQDAAAATRPLIAGIRPYYDRGLERPQEDERWRIRYSFKDDEELPQVPTGTVASIGSFGLGIDTDGDGPGTAGFAWVPNRSISVVAGGSLKGGGVGASLSVRLSF